MFSESADGQHDERTTFHGFDAAFGGQAHQFGVFGAGVEYDAFRLQGKNVFVVGALPLGVEVKRDGIDAFDVRWAVQEFDAFDGARPNPDGYRVVPVSFEAHDSKKSIP